MKNGAYRPLASHGSQTVPLSFMARLAGGMSSALMRKAPGTDILSALLEAASGRG